MLEIDQIFVIVEDFDICEGPPGILNLLSGNCVLRFLCDFPATLLVAAPSPLDLNGCNMVHGESVVLEKPSSQGHFVGGLDEASTEVSHALLLVLGHHVEP